MAKLECELTGNFHQILREIEDAVLDGSSTASCEETSDFQTEHCRCAVRVYERYSALGGNRVSLNLTLVQADGRIHLCAITSGGSQAMFFKLNTLGEKSFLSTIRETVGRYRK